MKNTSAIEIAKLYFTLSNQRNLKEIKTLLTDTTTYSSPNVGVFLGKEQIMEMKYKFYDEFKEMKWSTSSVEEIRPGVILFNFTFTGITNRDEKVVRSGLEYVIVKNGKLQHIEVRNE